MALTCLAGNLAKLQTFGGVIKVEWESSEQRGRGRITVPLLSAGVPTDTPKGEEHKINR